MIACPALLHVAYDLWTRAAELVAMPWAQIEPLGGGGSYRFGRTKTDQAGVGRTLYLRPESMAALAAWREVAPVDDDVFHAVDDDLYLDPSAVADAADVARWAARRARAHRRSAAPLSRREVGNVFRRAATLAGLDPDTQWLSGHSARVGAAVTRISRQQVRRTRPRPGESMPNKSDRRHRPVASRLTSGSGSLANSLSQASSSAVMRAGKAALQQ